MPRKKVDYEKYGWKTTGDVTATLCETLEKLTKGEITHAEADEISRAGSAAIRDAEKDAREGCGGRRQNIDQALDLKQARFLPPRAKKI